MSFETALQCLREQAPSGLVISETPDDVPRMSEDVRTPLFRRGDDVGFVVIAQPTCDGRDAIVSIPDALGINGETQVGEKRARRIMQGGHTDSERPPVSSEGCTLCPERPATKDSEAFAVDNGRPFGPLVHKVVCSWDHISSLADLRLASAVTATTELFRDIAAGERASRGAGCDGVTIGMNFGEYVKSGASQSHFHYQLVGLGRANHNAADRLGVLCRAYRRQQPGADYLRDYEAALRRLNLVLFDHELAVAYRPISPRFKDEIQIMLRRPDAGNILDLSAAERRALSELQCQVFARFDALGYRALNQVWYATRFSADNHYGQRLVMSCCPRSSVIAFYELSGNHVIDSLPWRS
jgi:diadenosine tetraphosphate (Ap4A) HIT family hydrolase